MANWICKFKRNFGVPVLNLILLGGLFLPFLIPCTAQGNEIKLRRLQPGHPFYMHQEDLLFFLRKGFRVNPDFSFFVDGNSPNALATPSVIRRTRPDGTVLMGVKLFEQEFKENFNQINSSVPAIAAHEFAHIVQFKNKLQNKYPTPIMELHADFLAGWFLANWQRAGKLAIPGHMFKSLFGKGDYSFNSPNHHGTPKERVKSAMEGYNSGVGKNISVYDAYEKGLIWVLNSFPGKMNGQGIKGKFAGCSLKKMGGFNQANLGNDEEINISKLPIHYVPYKKFKPKNPPIPIELGVVGFCDKLKVFVNKLTKNEFPGISNVGDDFEGEIENNFFDISGYYPPAKISFESVVNNYDLEIVMDTSKVADLNSQFNQCNIKTPTGWQGEGKMNFVRAHNRLSIDLDKKTKYINGINMLDATVLSIYRGLK